MQENYVLFFDEARNLRREIVRILTAAGCECTVPQSLSELERAVKEQQFPIYILDLAGHRHLTSQGVDLADVPTIVLSVEPLAQTYSYLSSVKTFPFFVAKQDEGIIARDLLVTIRKILDKDIFGVKKYLSWGASSTAYQVRDSDERHIHIESALNFCRRMKLRKPLLRSVQTFCEEMLMNAIYDAPRDQHGHGLYADQPRDKQVLLSLKDSAILEVASDGERLGISVSDPFGAITRNVVLKYLTKCFDGASVTTETSGAGLGLYLSFNAVSSFIVNAAPHSKTEFIGIFDLTSSVAETQRNHTSFYYFTTDQRASQFSTPETLRKLA